MIKTVIEFVSSGGSNPPTNVQEVAQTVAQTGDTLSIIAIVLLCCLLCLGAIAFLFREKLKFKLNNSNIQTAVLTKNKIAVFSIVAVILLALLMCFGISASAFAANSNTDSLVGKDKVQAVVNEETGEITIEDGFLKNISAAAVTCESISTELASGISDGGCNWQIFIDGNEAYNSTAGQETTFTTPLEIAAGASKTVGLKTNMTIDVAKQLIGKNVLTISFKEGQGKDVKILHTKLTNNGSFGQGCELRNFIDLEYETDMTLGQWLESNYNIYNFSKSEGPGVIISTYKDFDDPFHPGSKITGYVYGLFDIVSREDPEQGYDSKIVDSNTKIEDLPTYADGYCAFMNPSE